jgi:hypothetical protein
MTNLKPMDVGIVVKEITTRSELNVIVLEKKLRLICNR